MRGLRMPGISTIRPFRLHWLLTLTICALAVINLLFSEPFSSRLSRLERNKLDFQKLEARAPTAQKVGFSKSSNSAPIFKRELSFGVKEEENSAREVLDLEGGDRDRHGAGVDHDAANEVNSIEPDTNAIKKANLMDREENEEEEEEAFHQQPQEGEEKRKDLHNTGTAEFNNWRNLNQSQLAALSNLGKRLFLNQNAGEVQQRNFTILMWKTGPNVERRLLYEYGKIRKDPFRNCSVRNCRLTYNDTESDTADAILIHLHRTKGPDTFPIRTKLNQRWIWLSDESPMNTFMVAKDKNISHYNGYFNWSMNYRMESDVPVPYGRTIKLTQKEEALYQPIDYFSLKTKSISIMGSNCGGRNRRWNYVKELQKYIDVDTYGGCGTLKCPGHFMKDCPLMEDYKFYLAFENCDCLEYITEKVWWNSLKKGVVPVVMGSRQEDYRRLLPPNSFIHINDFDTPQDLANYLRLLLSQPEEYNKFHAWRSSYKVFNEHGYFASSVYHYCRLCEALNYNDPAPKMYNQLEKTWNKETQCYPTLWDKSLS